jgi:hypothetical protein
MDEIVARSIAKWPGVPAVYGWLALDRRGNWRIKDEKVANPALRDFICRNYEADSHGQWFFQNGPQRVYVKLAYTPLVLHYEGDRLTDHCGRPFAPGTTFVDEEGSVLVSGGGTIGLLDDRELARFADDGDRLPRIESKDLAVRFGFVADPSP